MQQISGHPGLISETMSNKQTKRTKQTATTTNKQTKPTTKNQRKEKKHMGSTDYTQHVYNQKTQVGVE